jgi:AcrR family transcriptional regulator
MMASRTQGAETRERILEAAHRCFLRQGYHGTSMRQIAAEAQLAVGGIYNHFEGKEQVFETVLYENHPLLQVLPLLETTQGDDLAGVVRNAAEEMLAALREQPGFLKLIFIEVVEFQSRHLSDMLTTLYPYAVEKLARFQKRYQSLRSIPVPMLLRTFMGLFFSYYATEIILGDAAPPEFSEDAMDHFVDIYLHGVMVQE